MDSICMGQTSLKASRNERLRGNLIMRQRVMKALRSYFSQGGFVEVDTPIVRSLATDCSSSLGLVSGTRLHVRACLEEYTRRCACLFGKAFEIGKCFRNEELATIEERRTHLPEFTMAEFYEVDADLEASLVRMEDMIRNLSKRLGIARVKHRGCIARFDAPFRRMKVLNAIEALGPTDAKRFALRHRASDSVYDIEQQQILRTLIDCYVVPSISDPTFLTHFPKSADDYPDPVIGNEVQRAELIVGGMELGEVGCLQENADILEEYLMQFRTSSGEGKLTDMDRDYLVEVRKFNCRVGGGGIGVDRLLMLFCESCDIRDVVWYPSWKVPCPRTDSA